MIVNFVKTIYVSKYCYITLVNADNIKSIGNVQKMENIQKLFDNSYIIKVYYKDGTTKGALSSDISYCSFIIDECFNNGNFAYIFTTDFDILKSIDINDNENSNRNPNGNPNEKSNENPYDIGFDSEMQLKLLLYKEDECILIKPFINPNMFIPINFINNFDIFTFYPNIYLWDNIVETLDKKLVHSKRFEKNGIVNKLNRILEDPYILLPQEIHLYSGYVKFRQNNPAIPLKIEDFASISMKSLLKHIVLFYEINLKYNEEKIKKYQTTNILLCRHLFYISQIDRIRLYHKNVTIKINPLNKKLYKLYGSEIKMHTFMKQNPIYSNKLIDKFSHLGDEYEIIDKISQLSEFHTEDMNIV